MHGLFFTGTDTGVGKTWVTAGVARSLRARGRPVRVCKPVATGAERVQGQLQSADALVLAEAVGTPDRWAEVTPWIFPEPVAPAVAARWHGAELTIESLAEEARRFGRAGDMVLVEGVGGLLCPLTETETVADLAESLQLPLVIVARRSLGTLNHTLLTLEAAQRRGLPVAGVVVNETVRPDGLADQSNVEELRRRLSVPILAVVEFREHGQPGPLPELDGVDWWQLGLGRPRTSLSASPMIAGQGPKEF
jgi:dethiobiotin synthetase